MDDNTTKTIAEPDTYNADMEGNDGMEEFNMGVLDELGGTEETKE